MLPSMQTDPPLHERGRLLGRNLHHCAFIEQCFPLELMSARDLPLHRYPWPSWAPVAFWSPYGSSRKSRPVVHGSSFAEL